MGLPIGRGVTKITENRRAARGRRNRLHCDSFIMNKPIDWWIDLVILDTPKGLHRHLRPSQKTNSGIGDRMGGWVIAMLYDCLSVPQPTLLPYGRALESAHRYVIVTLPFLYNNRIYTMYAKKNSINTINFAFWLLSITVLF